MSLKELELAYENSMIAYEVQQLSLERNITNAFYTVNIADSNSLISKVTLESSRKSDEVNDNNVEVE